MDFNELTLKEKQAKFESMFDYENNNSNLNMNTTFLVANGMSDCEREQMVSLFPMVPMLEKVNRVPLEEADYILYTHPIARSEDFTEDAINDMNEIMSRKKKDAEVIVMGKACNVKDYIKDDEKITYVKSHYAKYLGDRFGFDIKDQYFVYDEDDKFYTGYDEKGRPIDDKSTLNIWPVDGCNNKCGFCRRCFMHIEYESLPLSYLKEKLDWYKNNDPDKMKKIALRAENLTQYGIDLYGKPMLTEVIKLVDSYDEVESISFHIGLNIGEVTKEMAIAIADCKKIANISLNLEAGTDRLIKLIGKNHTIKKAVSLCNFIREAHPYVHIDSTVMVGLPTETLEDILSLAYAIEYCGIDNVLINHYVYSDKHGLSKYEQLDEKVVALHNKYLLKYLREIHNNGLILHTEYQDEFKNTRKDQRLKKLLEEESKHSIGKYHKAGRTTFFGNGVALKKNYDWSLEEYQQKVNESYKKAKSLAMKLEASE